MRPMIEADDECTSIFVFFLFTSLGGDSVGAGGERTVIRRLRSDDKEVVQHKLDGFGYSPLLYPLALYIGHCTHWVNVSPTYDDQ